MCITQLRTRSIYAGMTPIIGKGRVYDPKCTLSVSRKATNLPGQNIRHTFAFPWLLLSRSEEALCYGLFHKLQGNVFFSMHGKS